MSDESRKENGAVTPGGSKGGGGDQPGREEARPQDDELYTPQGGGGGTGSGPIREAPAVEGAPKVGPKEDLRQEVVRPGKVTLPQVRPEGALPSREEGLSAVGGDERPEASSFRLLLTLGSAGALAGALLVFVFLWSQPKILAYRAMVLREAVTEVLKGPDHFESVFLLDGELVTQVPEGVDTLDLDKVFLGYDTNGEPIGFAMEAEGFGFQDIIGLIFGYDPKTREVLGMKVLRHLETPGLGDKIVKDSAFVGEFDGVGIPILGVKPDRNTGDPAQVDMITGATISSKAVIRIINERIAEVGDLLSGYVPAAPTPSGVPADSGSAGENPGSTDPSSGNGRAQEEGQ